jgi:hypothetical protein
MRYSQTASTGLWRGALCAALVLCATTLAAQEVYKTVDADGHVVYSDRAPTKNAPTTTLHVTEPDPAEAARLAKQQQLLNAADRQRQKDQAADEKSRAAAEHKKQVACDDARSKYDHYRDSARIYQRDADGNRVFLSDADADALREQSRRAMVAACGT